MATNTNPVDELDRARRRAQANLSDMERALLRALHLGHRTVGALLAARMHCKPEDTAVRSIRALLQRGLRSRRSMETTARLFDVPPTFWMETDPHKVREMIDAPATTTAG